MTVIETKRLRLRPIVQDDLDALHRIYSSAEAMRYWSKPPFANVSQTQDYIDAVVQADTATSIEFAVEHAGRVIGRVGFWQVPEIGYIFDPEYWGQGFGTEAVGAVLHHGFDAHRLSHAIADVDPNNTASLRMLKSLGFKETSRAQRTIKIAGVWYDSVYLRVTPAELQSAK